MHANVHLRDQIESGSTVTAVESDDATGAGESELARREKRRGVCM